MRVEKLLSEPHDFSGIRDVALTYTLLKKPKGAGECYNVGSGKAVSIRNVLDMILSLTKMSISVEVDPTRLRPIDVPVIEANVSKLVTCTGWKQEFTLEKTIEETLEFWRNETV